MNRIIWDDMKQIEARSASWEWLKNKTVLITGAYGMIASYLVYFLIYLNEVHADQNTTILLLGRNSRKAEARFGEYMQRPYMKFFPTDLCTGFTIDCDVDYIIHAASLASPQYYAVDPVGVMMPNLLGTYNLLELARNKGCKGFLFFSSGDVYGKIAQTQAVVYESDWGCVDSMDLRSCYGESKRAAETMCVAYAKQYGVPTKSVRICHTYGPTLDLRNDQRMFAEFVSNVVNGQDIIMKSDGSATRSLCYLADATDAFFRILKDGKTGEAYNMCNNQGHTSIKDLAELLVTLNPEKQLKVVMQQRDASSAYMESPVKNVTEFNTDKLSALGWTAQYDIRTGFSRTIESFLEE